MLKQSQRVESDAPHSRILAATVSTTIAFAVSRGIAITEIETAIGIGGLELANPDARVPDDILGRIWKMLEEREPDLPLTVSMARAAPFTVFGGLAHGMQFAATLREALRLLTKNRALMADRLSLKLVEANGERVVGRNGHELERGVPVVLDELDDALLRGLGAGTVVAGEQDREDVRVAVIVEGVALSVHAREIEGGGGGADGQGGDVAGFEI